MLFGDREPREGVCGTCRLPAVLRRRVRPLHKPLTFTCSVCGQSCEQGRMGRPRMYCPGCVNGARRLRRRAR